MTIDGLEGRLPAGLPAAAKPEPGEAGAGGFASALGKVVEAVERTEGQANAAVTGMLDGRTDVHDAMIALQRADLTLQFSVQIRNKLVQAYQEIMRMPV